LLLAHLADGRPGTALHFAQNPDLLAARTERLDDLQALLSGGRVDRFGYATRFKPSAKATSQELKQVLVETLVVWLSFWRDVLQRAAGSKAPLINLDRQEQIEQIAAALDTETAQHATEQVEQMLQDLRTNINPQLAAEALLLDLPRVYQSLGEDLRH
jgi:DNA polymerase-3 subunit delta'